MESFPRSCLFDVTLKQLETLVLCCTIEPMGMSASYISLTSLAFAICVVLMKVQLLL
jgi:hypothetical protein